MSGEPRSMMIGMRDTAILVGLVLVACSGGKSGEGEPKANPEKWKAEGFRETTAEERAAAQAALAGATLGLTKDWTESRVGDGSRRFTRNATVLELYLANAEELVAVADEPPASLDELIARTRPGAVRDGWPFWSFRFKAIADQGASGTDAWIRGTLEKNAECGDSGCGDTWSDSAEVGFVMMRTFGPHRFRCGAHGLDVGGGNAALDEAFAACKAMTSAAR
jgi:hypothetical protein